MSSTNQKYQIILFICIINVVCISFYLYDNFQFLFGTTFSNYTYDAGVDKYQFVSKVFKNPQCLNGSNRILTICSNGRLGNRIWEYMSLMAFQRKYFFNGKIFLQCGMKENLQYVFDGIDSPKLSDLPESCISEAHVRNIDLMEEPKFFNFSQNNLLVILPAYSCRYFDVLSYGLENIRQTLRFRQEWIDKGTRELINIKATFGFNNTDIVTFIGVHYRGGDYNDSLMKIYTKKFIGPPSFLYYRNAMRYFKNTTKNPIFVFSTIDNNWAAKNLKYLNFNIVKLNSVGAVEDLVALSLCNHSIINYGTYGVSAALFANGTTFVYNLKLPNDGRGYTLANNIAKVIQNWFLCDNNSPCNTERIEI